MERVLIGLTGQIGAGKSSVAKLFASWGAVVIDADAIGKEVISCNSTLLKKLVKAFGAQILTPSGRLKAAELAKSAFADNRSTEQLNRLVHPYLLRELRAKMNGRALAGRAVVIDAALLHYWRLERELDWTIVVYAPNAVRFARLVKRGMLLADAQRRDRTQLPFFQMKRRSDEVIKNAGSRRELERSARAHWTKHIAPNIDR